MRLLQKLFQSREDKLFRYLLKNENLLEKGFNSVHIKDIREFGMLRCDAKFEVVNSRLIAEFGFSDFDLVAGNIEQYTKLSVVKEGDVISLESSGKKVRVNKELLKRLMDKFEYILNNYQQDQETRYQLFIERLLKRDYRPKEHIIGTQGIEEGKELILSTDTDIDLVFSRLSQGKVISVKDSEQLYLRNLEYSLEQAAFVNAKVRKLAIPADEKEKLISFIKQFIDSREVKRLFTEEELLLLKINDWGNVE
ncbi:hypothetical protein [Priestia megaterium]|uniref:Uncharacterized protein n=1 Tax=Priestia megaterium TaxID=1404 RepID=A0A6M6E936_PRIMG|nr:hypothetical protein [Priestia megaterium]QJX80938.1 hypothetical protein FDZ14_33135 [Priestia megaterium]